MSDALPLTAATSVAIHQPITIDNSSCGKLSTSTCVQKSLTEDHDHTDQIYCDTVTLSTPQNSSAILLVQIVLQF
eukprot:g69215.t1